MFQIHFNKHNGIYSIRRKSDRMTIMASERGAKPPRFGTVSYFTKGNFFLITPKALESARNKELPTVNVTTTNWPKLRVFIMTLKEKLSWNA